MKSNIIPPIFASLWLCSTFGQQNLTNARPEGLGIQLSIRMSTNVVAVGLPVTVHAKISNESTNTVYIFHSGRLPHDFGVIVTDESGKKLDLTPKIQRQPVNADFGSLNLDVPPGTARENDVRVTFEKQLAPGNYRLEFTREIHRPGVQNTNPVVSNPLLIRLIKNE